MSTITREWLQQKIADMEATRDEIPFGLDEDDSNTLAALRIALASLEAEAVADVVAWSSPNEERTCDVRLRRHDINPGPLYTAPPAPVSVPDENGLFPCPFCGGRPEEDAGGCSEYDGHEHQDYSINCKSCGAEVYCAVGSFEKADIPCSCHHSAREVCVEKWIRRAAMLQGAENAWSTTAMQAVPALDSSPKIAESPSGNSPVIPDGWKLVPIEPTEHMIVEGFESEPDEFFSDAEVWEAYDAMSGCQQAAHRAKLCWAAMIEAAPKLE